RGARPRADRKGFCDRREGARRQGLARRQQSVGGRCRAVLCRILGCEAARHAVAEELRRPFRANDGAPGGAARAAAGRAELNQSKSVPSFPSPASGGGLGWGSVNRSEKEWMETPYRRTASRASRFS